VNIRPLYAAFYFDLKSIGGSTVTDYAHSYKAQGVVKKHEQRETYDIADEPCLTCKNIDTCKKGFVCRDFIIYCDTNKAGNISRVPSRLLYFKHYR
jgi:hypothetical protein